jgi:hypothetical protein
MCCPAMGPHPMCDERGCMFNVAIMCVYGTRTVADEPHVYNTWARLRGHSGDRTATGDLRLSTPVRPPHDPAFHLGPTASIDLQCDCRHFHSATSATSRALSPMKQRAPVHVGRPR